MRELNRSELVAQFCNASRILPLRPNAFVKLTLASFKDDVAQVVHCDLAALRLVLRALPHVDYSLLRERNCHRQLGLSLQMPGITRCRPPIRPRAPL
jgi:hypothetical protein